MYKPFSKFVGASYWNNLETMRQLHPAADHFRRLHLRINLDSFVCTATNMLEIHELATRCANAAATLLAGDFPQYAANAEKWRRNVSHWSGAAYYLEPTSYLRKEPHFASGNLRTTFSVAPEYDPVGKAYEILDAWLVVDSLNQERSSCQDATRRWAEILYTLRQTYASAQVDYQAVAFTAEEEAAWCDAQKERERLQHEARCQREAQRAAAEAEEREKRRKYEELEDAAMDELKRRHRKERLLPPDNRSYPPSFLSGSGVTREIVEWYKNLKYKPPPAPRPLFLNLDDSSDDIGSEASNDDEEW